MSGYGNGYRGYSTYNDLAPKTDNWSKSSYASDHLCKPVIVDADGTKHPIVSFFPSNTETCVIETETIVKQQYRSPFVSDYKHNSHSSVEPLKDYGHVEDQWRRSSSPVHGHGRPQNVDEFLTKVQTEASNPKKFGLSSPSLWYRPPNSTGQHGQEYGHDKNGYGDYKPSGHSIQNRDYDKYSHSNPNRMEPTMTVSDGRPWPIRGGWAAPPDTARSRPTNDNGTDVMYLKEAARPTPVTSPHSRLSVPIKEQGYGHGNPGYGDYKPSGHTIQNGDNDEYNHNTLNRVEPSMTTSNGRVRPSPAGWSTPPDTTLLRPTGDVGTNVKYLKEAARPNLVTAPPHSRVSVPITTGPKRDHNYGQTIDNREAARPSRAGWATPPNTTLSRPTNDIGTALEYLKETARPTSVTSSPHSRVSVPISSTGPKRDHDYDQAIDSREAARRYGNSHSSPVPEEMYTGTIDSREAARKYRGTTV